MTIKSLFLKIDIGSSWPFDPPTERHIYIGTADLPIRSVTKKRSEEIEDPREQTRWFTQRKSADLYTGDHRMWKKRVSGAKNNRRKETDEETKEEVEINCQTKKNTGQDSELEKETRKTDWCSPGNKVLPFFFFFCLLDFQMLVFLDGILKYAFRVTSSVSSEVKMGPEHKQTHTYRPLFMDLYVIIMFTVRWPPPGTEVCVCVCVCVRACHLLTHRHHSDWQQN